MQQTELSVQSFPGQDFFRNHPIIFLGKLLTEYQQGRIGVNRYRLTMERLNSLNGEQWFTERHKKALIDGAKEFQSLQVQGRTIAIDA